MKEKQVISRIRNGDEQAFEWLFKQYYEKLCQWAYRYLRDLDSSEEVVQDLYYNLWRNRASMEFHVSVKSYLYKAVSNNCKMLIRKKGRRSAIEADLASQHPGSNTEPAELLEVKEIREVVNRTLEELPDKPAQIFRMSRYEGLKYREIAEKLSISIKTVEAN
ncbi:MAG: RNA polymerase sigma-70 factor, partial [Bacteroidales bacterium]|nr:RNA polymerase sigma-70 factor [Bacteroidales bacterium]